MRRITGVCCNTIKPISHPPTPTALATGVHARKISLYFFPIVKEQPIHLVKNQTQTSPPTLGFGLSLTAIARLLAAQARTPLPSDACLLMVELDGIEPTASCLQSRRSPN